MIERWMWGGGRLRQVLLRGIPFGFGTWLLQNPKGPWWASLTFFLAFGSGFFGLLMSFQEQGRAPLLAELPPADRVEVLDAVREGRPVADPRLAPVVVERTALWRKNIGTAARDRWILAAMAVGAAVWGIVLVRDSDLRPGVTLCVAAGLLVIRAIVAPGRATARLAKAEEAERYAREMLEPA